MSFLYPAFLTALSAIIIPIIIHLFNFRKYKKEYFTNVRFLKEINQKTQSQSQLRHYLVLISRILAIAFLVLAFSQPYIPVENSKIIKGEKSVSIFIDNSFSMDAVNKSGSLLDEAKKRAIEIAAAYGPTDKFQLLTNDFEGKHQRLVSKEEFLELLEEIKISPNFKSLSQIVSRQTDALNSGSSKYKRAFIISDFQKSICNFAEIQNDTSAKFSFVPIIAPEKRNVFIDSIWFETPVRQSSHPEKLLVRIKNVSEQELENYPVKLFINGKQKTLTSINIAANSDAVATLAFSSDEKGIHQCKVQLNDFPVTFDDTFYFTYNVAADIPLLVINSAEQDPAAVTSPFIASLFGKDSLFHFTQQAENKIDYSSFSNNRLIILNELSSISSGLAQELQKFVRNGGSLLIFPAGNTDLDSYGNFLSSVSADHYQNLDSSDTKVEYVNFENGIYKDVFEKRSENMDLPVVQAHYRITGTVPGEETLLKMANGDIFLNKYNFEKGKVYLSAVPLSQGFSNFPRHALFVPTLYKIAIYSQQTPALFYTIGKEGIIEIPGLSIAGEKVFHIINKENNFDLIPAHKAADSRTDVYLNNGITLAGNYKLSQGDSMITGLAFNYDRKESRLEVYSNTSLIESAENHNLSNFSVIDAGNKPLTSSVSEIDHGKKLWKLCIILALIFLAAETLLLRFRKTQAKHEPAT